MQDVVILGAGGHGREAYGIIGDINEVTPRYRVIGFLADAEDDATVRLVDRLGCSVLGPIALLADLDAQYVLGIGSGSVRRWIDGAVSAFGAVPATVVHPSASIGRDVDLGPGALVAGGVRITTNVRTGRHCHFNINSSVSHDCRLGDYVTVSPGSVVCGTCDLGDEVYVGANACIVQNRVIGPGSTVGAGAVVVRDVAPGSTVSGVPARAHRAGDTVSSG